ncbi:MAG: dienelactone hydrolase family protein [Bdellovibrionales bacterium]|nr:dienelactone hydrolase family protein [Bdellovibrionales bacterium]
MKTTLPLLALFLLSVPTLAAPNPDFSAVGPLPVEVLDFRDRVDSSRETVKTPDRPRLFRRFRQEKTAVKGRALSLKLHLPASGGPYPVVVISHGAGGNRDTHYAQAHHLASHGFAVLCLEHSGSNTDRMKEGIRIFHNLKKMIHDSGEVLGRPKDVSFALDQASEWNQADPKLKGRFDLSRVGVMGHSFGAYTVLAVSGARPALDWIEPKIEPGSGLGPDLSDLRVKCGIALSPQGPGDPFFLKESYSSIRIPILGISGTKDQQQNGDPAVARLESFNLWPPMKDQNLFLWLTDAAHLDFTDSTGGSQHGRSSANRADVQKVVRAAGLLFFNSCLKKDPAAASLLTTAGLKPYLGGAVSNLTLQRK